MKYELEIVVVTVTSQSVNSWANSHVETQFKQTIASTLLAIPLSLKMTIP